MVHSQIIARSLLSPPKCPPKTGPAYGGPRTSTLFGSE